MLWFVYNLLFPIAFLLMLPKFLSRMLRRGGYKKHFEQRFGLFGKGTTARLDETRRIWIHAVSVGEINIALRFIEEYRTAHADACFVLSTATSTAHALGRDKMDDRDVLIYFPLDMPFVMKRVFNSMNPLKVILVECEIWPNMIREAHRRNIPVSLINGRVSDSSFKGYMKLRVLMQQVLELINPLCMQGRQDVERMIAMGARPETVKTLGTAKYDLPLPSEDVAAPAEEILRQAGVPEDALILLGGSTWPGEEEALCEIYKTLREKVPALFLVLVPRHAERRDDVVAAIEGQGLTASLRSQGASKADVLVIDTTGELMSFYAASSVVFVGKSLCEHGGQNPIEPALFGKPIIVGPNMENFPSVMDDFYSAKALLQVDSIQALEKTIEELLSDPAARTTLGTAAAKLVESRRGVISQMVEAVG
ncbi:MAG: 3-deoxy-D-manno-octulosonic acid transferase [Kiritimatiellaceae bacterium]|nr:3-deoxy-D-manno-octulosonic acid transferase [Kiritimatiellaceae bacterium]